MNLKLWMLMMMIPANCLMSPKHQGTSSANHQLLCLHALMYQRRGVCLPFIMEPRVLHEIQYSGHGLSCMPYPSNIMIIMYCITLCMYTTPKTQSLTKHSPSPTFTCVHDLLGYEQSLTSSLTIIHYS